MRVLICEDDSLLQQVVRQVAESSGHEVVGETDHASAAIEFIGRHHPDIVIVDLSLVSGSGLTVIKEARTLAPNARVVVFSAFVSDAASLLAAGATAVIDKPRFDELEATLTSFSDASAGERRRIVLPRDPSNPIVRSPSGLETDRDFYTALAQSSEDDVLLLLWLEGRDRVLGRFGPHITNDWVLQLARATRAATRDHDHLACFDGVHVHALLLGGGQAGPPAVLARIVATWPDEVDATAALRVKTSSVIQDGTSSPEDLLGRVAPPP
jgi:DNA-binding response OmpR family regulator